MPTNLPTYKKLKTALWALRGTVKSSHLDQGLAHGFGFPDYHAMSCALEAREFEIANRGTKHGFDVNAFLERMNNIGYRPGSDFRDPHASIFDLAVTALSILQPAHFLETMKKSGIEGDVVRLDVTDSDWKAKVADYRTAMTHFWGKGTSGYVDTISEKSSVRWKINLPLRWKRGERIEIENSMIEVSQGQDFYHVLDERDAAKIRAIEAKTGESPSKFFSRVLTELRPYFPGFEDSDVDPIEDIMFTDDGLMVRCFHDNRRTGAKFGCSVLFEKRPTYV